MKRKHARLLAPSDGTPPTGGTTSPEASAVAPPATPPANGAPATPPVIETQNTTPAWSQSITDEALRTYVENKGFKDAGEAAKALQELETRNAPPATAADYKLPVPDGDDGAFAKQASDWMHKAGIPAAAGQKLAAQWNEFQASQAQAAQVALQQRGEKELGELRGEWGGQYDTNVELGRRAMRTFGVPAEVVEKLAGSMGDRDVIKVFHAIGKGMGESTLNPGDGGGGNPAAPADPEAARAARMFPSMKK